MTALTRLRLTDFRNYAALDLALDGRHVCLHGPNGAGKTNLLEAISQLSPGRGLRSASLAELARKGSAGTWTVAADLVAQPGEDPRRLGVGLEAGEAGLRRLLRLDGANASASDLAELVRVVWLTPAMDGVFRGGAGDRRRFFDRQVMAHIPAHGPVSAAYERALRERNALIAQGLRDAGWADALEARLAETGALIAVHRALILQAIAHSIDARPEGAFPKADLTLEGEAERLALAGTPLPAVQAHLRAALRDSRPRDLAAGRTLVGPHRTDLGVVHRPSGLIAAECSTGQQKALVMGLVLASARALAAGGRASAPLLLLDEAAAHLDAERRAALYDELDALGGQAWLTGTDAGLFEAFGGRAQRLAVCEGGLAAATD